MDIQFVIPGTLDPAITVRRTALGDLRVLVNGTPVKRRRGRAAIYDIPLSSGATTELRLDGQWTGLKATVNGVQTALEPPVPRIVVALIFLPLALAVLGGAIGGAIGAVTAGVNLTLSRQSMRTPIKLLSMVGATILGAAVWFGIAFVASPIPTLTTGDCLNGIRAGAELTASAYRPVSCATSHDNEVFGSFESSATGPFPGGDALLDAAQAPCAAMFGSYVGIDFQASTLEAIIITPSDVTWVKGDRTIACVAIAPNGGKLTGSIRGTAR